MAITRIVSQDIKDGTVAYGDIQNVSATDKVLGRSTAGAGTVEEIACTAAGRTFIAAASATAETAILDAMTGDSGAGGVKGLVPAPAAGDTAANKFLKASGAWVAITAVPTFVDEEVPAGTVDGVNDTFTVATTPSPAGSLKVFKNGIRQRAGGADYTLATATITFVAGNIPQTGDVLLADYRY